MVKDVVSYIKKQGHTNICADIPDYNKPAEIYWKVTGDGHIPDITSTYNNVDYIFEIEVADTINIEHTLSQLRLFSANSAQHKKTFIVVVPKQNLGDMQTVVSTNAISANIWTVGV
jgi:hypothetical protein